MSNYIITPNGGFYSQDELYHYGVPGMKWGHRKAQKYVSKARTARESAKEWKEIGANKAAKLMAKGKTAKADKVALKYKLKADQDLADAKAYEKAAKAKERGAKYQKKQAEVGASRSRGAKLATNLLAGPFANRTYNSVIAAGGSKNAARVITAVTGFTGGALGHLAVSSLYRRGAEKNMLISQPGRVVDTAINQGTAVAKKASAKVKEANAKARDKLNS